MLQFMRKHAKFFYIFFFLIIISFIFFYVGPIDKSSTLFVAEIEDEKIMLDEYLRTYERARGVYRDIYKEKFNDEMETKLKLKEKVLDSMIEEKVLLLAAEELGISVKDGELEEAIINEPAFTSDGVFDKSMYLRKLELGRVTPEFFEGAKRRELTIAKMKRLISESVDITDVDMKDVPKDEQTAKTLRQLILQDKRDRAVKSYVEGLKKRLKVKINTELLS